MAKKKYAVRKGRKTGIFDSWEECRTQVMGFSGAEYKSFPTMEEAETYMGAGLDKMGSGRDRQAEQQSLEAGIIRQAGQQDVEAGITRQDESREAESGVRAYVDGSYDKKTGHFSYGMIILGDGEEKKFAREYQDPDLAAMHNVAGEIKGAEAAMRYAIERGLPQITIYHDYEGIARWCLGEWKTNKEGTKKYKAYYDSIKDKVQVRFIKVKGHSNDTYNDIADELAKQALDLIPAKHRLEDVIQ